MDVEQQHPVELAQLDVEARDERGWTNVHIAVYNNRPEVLDFLLKNGANVHVYNDNGETPLHFAAALDSQQLTCALLKRLPRDKVKGYIDSQTYGKGTSALHVAAKNGAFGIVWLLLSYGGNFDLRNRADQRAVDVATSTAITKLLQTVELDSRFAEQRCTGLRSRLQTHSFFELDASLHSTNAKRSTLLQVAVINQDSPLTEMIVELRTSKQKDEPPVELLMCLSRLAQLCDRMKKQLNSLLKMCDERAILLADVALEEGIQLLSTALSVTRLFNGEQQHLAVIDETLEVLQFDGRSSTANARYQEKLLTDNKSDLYSFLDILKLTIGAPIALLMNAICTTYLGPTTHKYDLTSDDGSSSANLDLNKQDANGWTPLHYAVHNDKEDMVRALLDLKSDATLVTKKNKKTPLHMAAKNGNIRIVELLLKHENVKAYLDETSEPKGWTALHFAAKAERLDIVKCLLGRGANYRASDKKRRRCIDLAKSTHVLAFFKLVDELFAKAENADSDLVKTLTSLPPDDLTVVANVRTDQGSTLATIAKSSYRADVCSEILAVLNDRGNNRKES